MTLDGFRRFVYRHIPVIKNRRKIRRGKRTNLAGNSDQNKTKLFKDRNLAVFSNFISSFCHRNHPWDKFCFQMKTMYFEFCLKFETNMDNIFLPPQDGNFFQYQKYMYRIFGSSRKGSFHMKTIVHTSYNLLYSFWLGINLISLLPFYSSCFTRDFKICNYSKTAGSTLAMLKFLHNANLAFRRTMQFFGVGSSPASNRMHVVRQNQKPNMYAHVRYKPGCQ